MRVLKLMLAVAWLALGIESRAATHIVRMANFSFTPSSLTVDVGDTVIWTNTVITGHDTVCQGVWASRLLAKGGTFSFTFNVQPRIYNYVCSPHVSFGMVGSITVRAPVNNPPTASIISPPNGQVVTVGNPIAVEVNASDDNGVNKVDVFVDGVFAQTDSTSPYQFNITGLAAGNHTLLARATDAAGLTGESSIAIAVQFENPAPLVTLTSPTNNAVFEEPATVVLSADIVGSVDRVEFLTNGVILATDTTPPFLVTNIFSRGAYTITARAIGLDTQISASAPIDIEVGAHVPKPPRVFIVSPVDGEFIPFGITNVTFSVQTADEDSGIAQLQVFLRDQLLISAAVTRFEFMTALSEGIYTLSARATDTTGLVSTSAPVRFTIQMAATNTYRTNIAPGVVRLGYFGSSGLPYIFEYSTNMVEWIPYKTNELYRRILFFDVLTPTNEPARFFRARTPGFTPPETPP